MKIRIRSEDNGTYFRDMASGVLPVFGATWEQAATFSDGWDAYNMLKRFPMVVDACMVNEKRQPCDISGKKLKDRRAAGKKGRGK